MFCQAGTVHWEVYVSSIKEEVILVVSISHLQGLTLGLSR